ncbi:MAG: hypothetical protein ABSH28_12430 [Acidobacteriota bacterium]|jgi:Ca2+-binding EF-hand superfamily protein
METRKSLLIGLVLALSVIAAAALSSPAGELQYRWGLAGGQSAQQPQIPLMAALDTNQDGVLDAQEIANAPAVLLTLDKNGDGKLTPDELFGPLGVRGGIPGPRAGGAFRGRGAGMQSMAANGTGGRGPGGPPQPVFAALDTNHDGVIDGTEIANAASALLTLDKNHDGKLTPDELFGPRGGPGLGPSVENRLFNVLDANHDGIIDATEIANASAALKTLDKNQDGKLTPDELFGPPGGRGGMRGQPPAGAGLTGRGPGMRPMAAGGAQGGNGAPPEPPLLAALDANSDGIIDADEIANAPAALKVLDKNGDGQLTRDELRPIR